MAELFATSKQNINLHISKILIDKELDTNSVVKYSLTTAIRTGARLKEALTPTTALDIYQ